MRQNGTRAAFMVVPVAEPHRRPDWCTDIPIGYALSHAEESRVAGAGGRLVGAAAMTAAEKVEQRLTGRPDSHVPGRVLARLTGLPEQPTRQPRWLNLTMHYGQGALVGILRSVMAQAGLRGPVASGMFTVARLTSDQILENAQEPRLPR